jgi:2,4-dienoyl-CoA reductase-like NADH-dependent reductase (Old Yellow Enzyme family)
MTEKQLFTSYEMSGLTLKNRIVLAPMTRARANADRVPNELMAQYYAQRSGAGLLITEATVVSEQGIGWVDSPGIYTETQAEGWKLVTEAVHAEGASIILQLWHCGRASHSAFHGGRPAVAPSAVKLEGDHIHTPDGPKPYETPRALETDEIPAIVADFARATELARAAGFDGVEVHAANGYLLNQFLESKTNHRTDGYGGSVEKRFRLLGEVVEAASRSWSSDRVGVRLSPNGSFNDMGSPDYRETFTYAAGRLQALGLGYLHVVDGLAFGFHKLGEPVTLEEAREVYHGTLVGSCGYDFATAEAAVGRGAADLIAFGRPFINNPDLPARFANGWPLNEEIDMSTWYSGGDGAKGYTDLPAYEDRK